MLSIFSNQLLTENHSTGVAGLLTMLEDENEEMQSIALRRLYHLIDEYWAEVSSLLPLLDEISEDINHPDHELAAGLASKCFFHLEEYDDALSSALKSGPYFDITQKNQYIDTLLVRCIDKYISQQRMQESFGGRGDEEDVGVDPEVEEVVERMFHRCFGDRSYSQAVGLALECRRLDKLEETLHHTPNKKALLAYTFSVCQATVENRNFRLRVLELLVKEYSNLPEPDFGNVCQCLQFLNQPGKVVEQLDTLLRSHQTDCLIAYQVAFDMVESENQGFVLEVVENYPALRVVADRDVTLKEEFKGDGNDEEEGDEEDDKPSTDETNNNENEEEENDEEDTDDEYLISDKEYTGRLHMLRRVLCDNITVDISLNFLFKQCHSDAHIIKIVKEGVGKLNKASMLHHSALMTYGIMNAGTAIDNFLRDNIDWFGEAKLWSKFSGVASIGLVHKGHVHESMNLLEPYLPQGGVSNNEYSEGGALYALGLIHANNGGTGDSETIHYLTDSLRNAGTNEVVQHGASLGLGLAAMGTGNPTLYTELLNIIYTDSAVAGEGAALGIGLLFVGKSGSSPEVEGAIRDLLAYAHDTKHEKIIRALALAVSFMVYGQEELADGLIEQLLRDHDAIVRYGAVYAIGLAYVGTNNNTAVQKLLHIAVSDVNDDVRRAAVTCLGFVLFKAHEQVPKLVALLAESFNPYVRYGACMAVGIACAGTGSESALDLLKPMMKDEVDFVRQGVFMAIALVLMQISSSHTPFVTEFRETMRELITNKRQTQIAKMGAILACGLIDAGGRNMVMSMQSRAGFLKMSSIIGCALWMQFWYWHPLMNMVGLSLTPTMLLGLNKDFNIPKNFTVKCNSKPSMFAYPENMSEEKDDKKARVKTAVLSTTAKAKAKEARKEAQKMEGEGEDGTKMVEEEDEKKEQKEKEEEEEKKGGEEEEEEKKDGDMKEEEEEDKKKEEEEPEPLFHHLSNPARITSLQIRSLSIVYDQKYTPVRQVFYLFFLFHIIIILTF